MANITPVILSGGSGTRLWPLSRKQYPKQFLPLVSNKTMLQETILRLKGLKNLLEPIIICNIEHRFIVAEQCLQIGVKNPVILLEPIGRNTAPAIAAAAFQSIKNSNNSTLLVLSADHIIKDTKNFHDSINIGYTHALLNKIAIFGIVPKNPNIGYGYIKPSIESIDGVFKVEQFVEKPDLKTAKSYIDQGCYLWNSGMFMFRANVLIEELNKYSPDIVKLVGDAVKNSTKDLDFIRLEKKAFELTPNESIDSILMEKSKNIIVIPLDAEWNDIGSFSALYETGKKDVNGNVLKGDVLATDTINCYINANHHLVATIGIKDLVVVDTPDATLISTLDKAQEFGKVTEYLKLQDREEQYKHRKVYRPWGWYDSIEIGKNFQVKKLHINPKAKLSLQMHHKRAEHWVVVAGNSYMH